MGAWGQPQGSEAAGMYANDGAVAVLKDLLGWIVKRPNLKLSELMSHIIEEITRRGGNVEVK